MKTQKMICLSTDVVEEIGILNKEGFNFSEWVEKRFFEEFMTEEGVAKRIEKNKQLYESAKQSLKRIKKEKQVMLENLTQEQKDLLLESKKILKERPELLKGRTNLWNNTYQDNLTKQQFLDLLEKIDSEP